MLGKITDAAPSVRRNTVLYLVGRAAVLAAVLLTLADIVRVYMAYGTEIAVGMMIPRMGALLGFSGSGVAGVLCTAVAFLFVIATALSVALAGRWYAWSIVALVLFSLDTLVTVWLFAASPSVGFLPALLVHIAVEVFLAVAVAAGRKLVHSVGREDSAE